MATNGNNESTARTVERAARRSMDTTAVICRTGKRKKIGDAEGKRARLTAMTLRDPK
jgi:hypothetical protein